MDGQKLAGWQRHERREVGTQIKITLQVWVEFTNRSRFVATNADLLHDLHLTQADEEQAAISRMDDGVVVTDERDGFGGWIVFERPCYSAKLRSIGMPVEPHAAAGDDKKAFARTIKTWRCRVRKIRTLASPPRRTSRSCRGLAHSE